MLKKQIINKIEHLDDLQILEDVARILDLNEDKDEHTKLNTSKKNQWKIE